MRYPFQNFSVDHMTLLVQPKIYNVVYCTFRILFGVSPDDILYDKRKEWRPGEGERSMTFATRIGHDPNPNPQLNNTIIAVVQPTEPGGQSSHVREMLDSHHAAAHWQHIALRTPDLLKFHEFALARGVQFVTPILKDEQENLIQVFSGEWYFSGSRPSGVFFEFVQREPSDSVLAQVQMQNRESWFRDKTFLGLYQEKEREYQSGNVTPFFKFDLLQKISDFIGSKQIWQITDSDLVQIEQLMLANS